MKNETEKFETENKLNDLSSEFKYEYEDTAIILAAGHGKRIKSHTSKMLHKIWGIPTVERVFTACNKGFDDANIILVVGIKADEVSGSIGKRKNALFAYQEEQNGTGHAVQKGLALIDGQKYSGNIYVFPGDMGLIDFETVKFFKNKFENSHADMMVLTGMYDGKPEDNSYGRILRVKEFDADGQTSGSDAGKVIEIIEHKDILNRSEDQTYDVNFNGGKYSYSKKELLENPEFNSGVYAFNYKHLANLVNKISDNNAQGEIYLTDLISIFNETGLTVDAVSPNQQHVIMGFNNKSVLKEMESIARKIAYDKLKDVITIEDPDDFFIDDEVIESILGMDKPGAPLDIKIQKGVYIGRGAKLNYNLRLKRDVHIDGNIIFGKNVTVWEGVLLSAYPEQTLKIGDNVKIYWGDIIKGNIEIGDNSEIESSVNMTGSDEFPLRIGENVIIKGTSYLFGSIIDDDIFIEHSVLIKKKVEKVESENKIIKDVRFFIPDPEGSDAVTDL